jgi:hypothetical protein
MRPQLSLFLFFVLSLLALGACVTPASLLAAPLRVHSSNSRYFTDGSGKAVYLTGSHTWHNLADPYNSPPFDWSGYLHFLQQHNHNYIRLWAIEPWVKDTNYPSRYSRTGPGLATDGRPKFDLNKFDQTYFDRLRSRVIDARNRDIYVGIMLWNGWSLNNNGEGNPWPVHYFNIVNNINNVNGDYNNGNGEGEETQILTSHAMSTAIFNLQTAYVRKVIDTVNDLDNIIYEISNESRPSSKDWQYQMVKYIRNYESGKAKQHPVGMVAFNKPGCRPRNENLFNSPADWISPGGGVWPYSDPPISDGSKVILLDTDHIWGVGGDKVWVWKSFSRGYNTIFMDDLTANSQFESARIAMGQTLTYANKMSLPTMFPHADLASSGYVLADLSKEYLIYQPKSGSFIANLSSGDYTFEWFNPSKGSVVTSGVVSASGGNISFTPPFSGDAVLYLKRLKRMDAFLQTPRLPQSQPMSLHLQYERGK